MAEQEKPHDGEASHHHDEEQVAEKPDSTKKPPGQGLTLNLGPKKTEDEAKKEKQDRVSNLLDPPTDDDDEEKLARERKRPWLIRPKEVPLRAPRYVPETSADWDTPITGVANLPNTKGLRRE